ncbi:hypothetical protein LOAG_17140 [Loa loa]|uniref:C2H2-type domain-containing protein n=1 Tax=Loa loa TaxID=7209 RepID=A0A1S0UK14_LOALO|nr:hypothetical protein LOAG_17140 [Loa loa]EJD75776.1 hypothetical protein LOAG_17140 [Loa loa]
MAALQSSAGHQKPLTTANDILGLPNFAIVRIPEGGDIIKLFSLLLNNGFPEVSFVNEIRENAFLPVLNTTTTPVSDLTHFSNTVAVQDSVISSDDNNSQLLITDDHHITHPSPAPSSSNSIHGLATSTAIPSPIPFVARPRGSRAIANDDPSLYAICQLCQNKIMSSRLSNLTNHSETKEVEIFVVFVFSFHPNFVTADDRSFADSVISSDDNNSQLLITDDHHITHPSPAPSSSNSIHGLATSTAIPSPIPFVARPRGSRAIANDDPSLYAICQLCQNKIMSSRLSNLTNHVRRHASLKQFQCVYCIYTHNEMAKVRLHMQHNHKDHVSQPLDALTPEMQNQWDLLMDQCFPGYSKFSTFKGGENDRSADLMLTGLNDLSYACIECGERVSAEALIEHLDKVHRTECIPYCCEECGYQNADQWKVRLHITLKHSEIAADVNVEVLEPGSNLVMFLHKYFPDTPADEEENKMLTQFQSLAPKEERNSMSPINFNGYVTSIVEVNNDTGNHVRCELCQKMMPNYRSLSSLMNHAKRHYHLKQYQCSECSYTSSEAAHVRTHMALKHPHVGAKPIDNNCEMLQNAWIDVMRKCFPGLISKIDQFRFKHSRSEDGNKEENSVDDGEIFTRSKRSSFKNHTATSPQRKLQKLQNGKVSGAIES